jgi:anti-sigma regulatory factor (Ser/Thr protein kinase)
VRDVGRPSPYDSHVSGFGGAVTTEDPLRLDPVAEAAPLARRYVRDRLEALGHPELVECALIGVSELVTNACLHARTALIIAVQAIDGRMRVEVSDSSPQVPATRSHGAWSTTGRGLRLVESAGAWGVEARADGKTVWFEPGSELTDAGFAIGTADGGLGGR